MHAKASPTPVFPEEGSTIVPPGVILPDSIASRSIAIPILSLTDPPGFMNSNFARTRGLIFSVTLLSLRRGVFPMRVRMSSAYCKNWICP
jgi:hypothetical protein